MIYLCKQYFTLVIFHAVQEESTDFMSAVCLTESKQTSLSIGESDKYLHNKTSHDFKSLFIEIHSLPKFMHFIMYNSYNWGFAVMSPIQDAPKLKQSKATRVTKYALAILTPEQL